MKKIIFVSLFLISSTLLFCDSRFTAVSVGYGTHSGGGFGGAIEGGGEWGSVYFGVGLISEKIGSSFGGNINLYNFSDELRISTGLGYGALGIYSHHSSLNSYKKVIYGPFLDSSLSYITTNRGLFGTLSIGYGVGLYKDQDDESQRLPTFAGQLSVGYCWTPKS